MSVPLSTADENRSLCLQYLRAFFRAASELLQRGGGAEEGSSLSCLYQICLHPISQRQRSYIDAVMSVSLFDAAISMSYMNMDIAVFSQRGKL